MVRRVAVLVDGDNLSAVHAEQILTRAAALGRVDAVRVYADANRPSDWLAMPGYRLMHAGTGKNASDLLLAIDAMELALASGIEAYVIATSDGDSAHLASRLREYGRHVLGMGEAKAPATFRAACSEFAPLAAGREISTRGGELPARCTDFDRKIREMIAAYSRNGRGMRIAELAPRMHSSHGTLISASPERSWRAYLASRPQLYDLDPKGPEAMVRFRPGAFAAG